MFLLHGIGLRDGRLTCKLYSGPWPISIYGRSIFRKLASWHFEPAVFAPPAAQPRQPTNWQCLRRQAELLTCMSSKAAPTAPVT